MSKVKICAVDIKKAASVTSRLIKRASLEFLCLR